MPPRHAYWTILVDDQPTAFRAHDAEELLPTLNRLKEKNPSAVMKWFERGQLYGSRDAARDSGGGEGERRWEGPRPDRDDRGQTGDRSAPRASGDREGPRREGDRRDRNWRPGGEHKDPRQKYKDASKAKWDRFKKNIRDRSERGRAAADATEGAPDLSRASSGESRDPEAPDPQTFSPPHGDPLREHIDEHVEETPGFDEDNGETPDDPVDSEPSGGDGAPSRPHGDPVHQQARPGGQRSGSSPEGSHGRRDDNRGGTQSREGSGPLRTESRGEWRDRPPRDRERSGGGGYQGNKPWGGGGGDRDRRSGGYQGNKPWGGANRGSGAGGESRGGPPDGEGGWRPPSADRSSGDRSPRAKWDSRESSAPPRRDDNRGGFQNRERPGGGGGGYQGNKPWGGDKRGSGGYQGNKPWGGANRGSGAGGESRGGPPDRAGGWRPPSADRSSGDRPPRATWDSRESSAPPRRDDNRGGFQNRERPGGDADWRDRPREDRGGSGGRPGYEGKKPWGGGGAGPSDRARKPWGPKAGGGKPWGAGPGNRPPTGGKPGGGKPPFGPRGPRKRRDDQ